MTQIPDIRSTSGILRAALLIITGTMGFSVPVVAQQTGVFYERLDAFLGAHVNDGLVDYAGIKAEPAGLNQLLADIAGLDRSALSAADEQAFLTNSYNVLVIKNVIDHYPLDSPLSVDGFFDREKFEVAGVLYTLDDLEKKELFEKYPDPRFHFALVCAAIGCPSLINSAYRGETLEMQLDVQTRQTLNSPKHVRVDDDAAYLSEIFSWYKDDFVKSNASIQGFINRFRDSPVPENARLEAISYDWGLNDAKKRP